jgi:hypothetical protein
MAEDQARSSLDDEAAATGTGSAMGTEAAPATSTPATGTGAGTDPTTGTPATGTGAGTDPTTGTPATGTGAGTDPTTATPAAATASDPETGAAAETSPTDHQDLMRELAQAMHTAIESQYEKLNAELEERRAAQVQAIAVRASAESEQLKTDSQVAIKSIDAWAKSENDLIKRERQRRIDARRERLASQLDLQETIKGRQVFAVEVAIDAHRSEVDALFDEMGREWDPVAIVRILSDLPEFPSLTGVIEEAGRVAAAEYASLSESAEPATDDLDAESRVIRARLMAVMDPDATRTPDGETARPWDERQAVGVAAGPQTEGPDVAERDVAEQVAEPAALRARVGGPLIRSIPSTRPMAGRFGDAGEQPGRSD